MKRKSLYVFVLVTALTFVLGCATDAQNLEMMNYASTIGVDYRDGMYYGYVQFIDFQSVAKTEGPKPAAKTWIGEGVGETYEESLFDIYRTAQERIYWGHVTSIVISESAFKQGLGGVIDSISRYFEFRRTPWVFGTRESMKDIFAASGFFGQSPLSTILHEPTGIYSQRSIIKSIKLHRLIAQIYEPGYTSCIPTIAINKKQWTEGKKPDPKLMFDGAIFLKNDSFRSYIPIKDLEGLRWMQSNSVRVGIPVPNKTNPSVQMVVEKPKTKFQLVNDGDKPQYIINMKASGYTVNRTNNNLLGLQQLKEKTEEAIEKEIRKTFQAGRKKQTDILNLEHTLYRKYYHQWKSLSPAEDKLLVEKAIQDINIDLNIKHTSSNKNELIK